MIFSRMHPVTRRALTIACFVLAVISVLGASAISVAAAYQERVLPRTYVAGASLGNQKFSQANAAVANLATAISSTPLTIELNGQTATLTPAELGLTIDSAQTVSSLTAGHSIWDWANPHFWRNFVIAKHLAFHYNVDETVLKSGVEQKLSSAKLAKDAAVTMASDGTLTVSASETGQTLDLTAAQTEIARYLTTGSNPTIHLTTIETPPQITTNEAERVKGEVEQTIQPVVMQADNQKFTFTSADIYGLIAYAKDGATLKWQIDEDKLNDLINQRVAKKLNVTMVQKVIRNDNNAVVTEGKDGKSVDSAGLAKVVLAALQNKTNTSSAPLPITVKTIAFTEKHVNPDFVPGLWPGVYVDVNLHTQRMYIMNGNDATQTFLISSGLPSLPTPTGVFYIMNKITLARSPLYASLWMPKWNALTTSPELSAGGYRGYGIHDLPCFDKDCHYVEGEAHLGHPVSHGCVRLGHADAAWFYDNIPVGTPVNIHT